MCLMFSNIKRIHQGKLKFNEHIFRPVINIMASRGRGNLDSSDGEADSSGSNNEDDGVSFNIVKLFLTRLCLFDVLYLA